MSEEFDKMLFDRAKLRESQAYQLGDGIRRSIIWAPRDNPLTLDEERDWQVEVWDDEYFTTVRVLSPDQPDDSIKRMFLYLKRIHYRG